MSTTPSNEGQKVAEWAGSVGLEYHDDADAWHLESEYWGSPDTEWMSTKQVTFFYKERQADRKRLLDKVESDVVSNNEPESSNGLLPDRVDRRNQLRTEQRSVLDKIRKEEL